MPKITKIEAQKNNKERFNVYIDGNFYCTLTLSAIMGYDIRTDGEVDLELLATAQESTEKSVALSKAIDYLSRGLKTNMQMVLYLKKKGYVGKIIGYVIEKLQSYGYLDDSNYAQAYINAYKDKKGKIYIKNQLLLKGVDKSIVESLLSEMDGQDEEAYTVLKKYLKYKENNSDNLRKAYRYVLQKGFSYSEADGAIERYKEENPCEE